LIKRDVVKKVGLIVVSSDKGLCGGLNTNVLRMSVNQMQTWEADSKEVSVSAIGNKSYTFMTRIGAAVNSHAIGLGDTPEMQELIGTIKTMLDAYAAGEIDELHICYTKFINTMKQEATMEQVLPLSGETLGSPDGSWDYIYEPEAVPVIDQLMTRYVESLIYNAVAENMASEQSSRMVAMKSASDNAKNVISELKLVYNKARQAAITQEISEIVGGAAAVS